MALSTQERIAAYLERRATVLEDALKPGDSDPLHAYASRASQLRLEAANIRRGFWKDTTPPKGTP